MGFFSQLFGGQPDAAENNACNDDASDEQDVEQYFAGVIEKAQGSLENADASNPTVKMAINACIVDDVEFLKKMDANGFSQWNNPKLISNAVAFGNVASTKFLLERGANANTVLDTDVKNFVKTPVLTTAVTAENMEMCELLVSNGADVNATDDEGLTALFYAAGGSLEICRFLVSNGADVNAGEVTALAFAQSQGCTDVANYLISVGARR